MSASSFRPIRNVGLTAVALALAVQAQARAETPENPAAAPVTTVTVEDSRDPAPIGQQPDAEGITDYRVTHGTTGAKSNIPNADIPQAVVAIPQRILEEQRSETLNDVFRNVAGAQATQSAVQGAQWPIMRGFETRNFYKDGMRDDTFDRSFWLGNVERMEVLKGPASVLYGDGSLGGVVNVVSKKPLPSTSATGSLWGGSYENAGISGDMSAKLVESGAVLARVIADTERKDTFIDNFGYDTQHFSALLQARAGDRTTITLGTEYRHRDQDGNDFGLPAYALDVGLPRSRSYDAEWSERTDMGQNVSARITHDFDGNWKIGSGLLLNRYSFDQTLTSTSFTAADIALNQVRRTPNSTTSETREVLSDTTLEGNVPVAGINNKVLVGAELSSGMVHRDVYGGAVSTTNLFNPVTSYAQPAWAKTWDQDFDTDRKAAYAQDFIELTPKLKVMGGIRYDIVRRQSEDAVQPANAARNATTREKKASKRVGVTYEAVPGITVYGGWARSFVPPGTSVSVGTLPDAPPEMGEQYEGGVKVDVNDAFTATAAVYQLTRENVRTTNSVTGITTVTGEQRSNGVELDATWKVAPRWNLLLAYAYTDARVTKDDTYVIGSALPNVPTHSGRLWSMYEIDDGPLGGLGFGGGLTYVGERAANLKQQVVYTMPGYTTVDLAAYYQANDHVRLSLNADNVFDKRYYIGSGTWQTTDTPMVNVGEPFTIMGRIQVTY